MESKKSNANATALPHHIYTSFDLWIGAATQEMSSALAKFLANPKMKDAPKMTNEWGVTPLHIAATVGNLPGVKALIHACPKSIDLQDLESGWTALHRAIYYGHYTVAITLIRQGADLFIRDNTGVTCFELLVQSTFIRNQTPRLSFVYTSGNGVNFQLGHGGTASMSNPKRLESLVGYDIVQTACSKFHTVALHKGGTVFTWGLGTGGRLGHGNEDTLSTPTELTNHTMGIVKSVAASSFCTAAINENGLLYVWGDNRHNQLAISGASTSAIANVPTLVESLRQESVEMVQVGEKLVVVLTKTGSVFLWGTGFKESESVILQPKRMPSLEKKVIKIAVSDTKYAAICENGDAFICGRSVRKVVLPAKFPPKVRSLWKKKEMIRNIAATADCFYFLTDSGDIYAYLADKSIVRVPCQSKDHIVDISAYDKSLFAITSHGVLHEWKDVSKKDRIVDLCRVSHVSMSQHAAISVSLACIPEQFIFTLPSQAKENLASMIGSRKGADLCFTISGADRQSWTQDWVHEFPSVVYGNPFHIFAHKVFVLNYLPKIQSGSPVSQREGLVDAVENYTLRNVSLKMFLRILELIYTRATVIPSNHKANFFNILSTLGFPDTLLKMMKEETKLSNADEPKDIHFRLPNTAYRPVLPSQPVPQALTVESHSHVVDDADHDDWTESDLQMRNTFSSLMRLERQRQERKTKRTVTNQENQRKISQQEEMLRQWNASAERYADTILIVEGQRISTHRSILMARCEYFQMMFSGHMTESSMQEITLHEIPYAACLMALQFIYFDRVDLYPEDAFQVMMVAQLLLLQRLVSICEAVLAVNLDPATVIPLLEYSSSQSLEQLKTACLEYISRNIAFMISSKLLNTVGDEGLADIEEYMRATQPQTFRAIPHPFLSLRESSHHQASALQGSGESEVQQLSFVQSEAMKRLRGLRKKLAQANQLFEKAEKGDSLSADQLRKIEARQEFEQEIASILDEHPILHSYDQQKAQDQQHRSGPSQASESNHERVETIELADIGEDDIELQMALLQQYSTTRNGAPADQGVDDNQSTSVTSSPASSPLLAPHRSSAPQSQSMGASAPIDISSPSGSRTHAKISGDVIVQQPKHDSDAAKKLATVLNQIDWQKAATPVTISAKAQAQSPSSSPSFGSASQLFPQAEPKQVSLREILAEEQAKKKVEPSKRSGPSQSRQGNSQQYNPPSSSPMTIPSNKVPGAPQHQNFPPALYSSPKSAPAHQAISPQMQKLSLESSPGNQPTAAFTLAQYISPANRKQKSAKQSESTPPPKPKEAVSPWSKPVAPVVQQASPVALHQIFEEEKKKKHSPVAAPANQKQSASVWFKPVRVSFHIYLFLVVEIASL
eukprot:TRINITY_DN6512_c0_g1_i13.p1 TRINITY_DN6512_c0_g1~~TRINITY_DN6512_c0_g1_i13.p1  ORF type:complete len:1361 (+),score=283.76 TRINITY_DN6512_c0_g1_i13:99-4181(+)